MVLIDWWAIIFGNLKTKSDPEVRQNRSLELLSFRHTYFKMQSLIT